MLSEEEANIYKVIIDDAIEVKVYIKVLYDYLIKKCKVCKEFKCDKCSINILLNRIATELLS